MAIFNTLFIFLNHPLTIGIVLIAQTIIIAIFSGLVLPSFWYSYILVLVFLGGLLILFIYVSTMAANEQIGAIPITFMALTLLFIFSIINFRVKFVPRNLFSNNDSTTLKENYAWIFSLPSSVLAGFLIIYLFIVLIAIVKITKF
jgi:NADH-ubiquinone oxidoreductase chain 6